MGQEEIALRGHYYVVFGKEYEKAALASIKRLRLFSDLYVQIVTNIPKKHRDKQWNSFDNIIFTERLDLKDSDNRIPKLRPDKFSVFTETLYTDADTLICSTDFMRAFDFLKYADIAVATRNAKESEKILRTEKLYRAALQDFPVYDKSMLKFVYHPGVLAFKKNKRSAALFEKWYQYWAKRKLRDMPPLLCAVAHTPQVTISLLPRSFGFINSKIIRHFSGKNKPKPAEMPHFVKQLVNENETSVHFMKWVPKRAFQ